jgi:O-antigen/teichoic acid export membrane protein
MFGMWVITYLVIIISGATDAGLLALAISSTNVFYTISVWGMRTYQVSDLQGKFADNTYIMSRFITCVVSILACAVFVFVKGFSVEQRYCILLYMVFKISEALADVYNGIVQRHWRMDIIGKSYIVRAILTVAAFCLVLEFTDSLLLAILAMMICSYAVIFSYDIVQTVKIAHVKIRIDFHGIDKLLITCAPLIVCSFLYSDITQQ